MTTALVVAPGQGETVRNPVGGDITFKVMGQQSGGALLALETVAAPGEGPPLHRHAAEDETLYVLEGTFRVELAGELRPARRGTYVFIPRGMPHTWQNVGETSGRMLVHFVPAGMEDFFLAFAGADAGTAPREAFAAAAAKAGMEVLGPPIAARYEAGVATSRRRRRRRPRLWTSRSPKWA